MKVLVTGATGMVGRALVDALSNEGASLFTTSLDTRAPWPDIPFRRANLCDFQAVRELCAGMDVVVHVAGIKGSVALTRQKPATFMTPLLQMNTNVFAAVLEERVPRVVFTSSIGVYPAGDFIPESAMLMTEPPMDLHPGWAKRIAELQLSAMALEDSDFSYAVVRPSNVYGPGDNFNPETAMVVGSLLGRAIRGENPIPVQGGGTAIRDFVYSQDVADALRILALGHARGDFNVGAGSGVTIRELADDISFVTGSSVVFGDPSADEGFSSRILDVSKARRELGWAPETSLVDGLAETWKWLKAYGVDQVGRVDYFTR